MLKFVSRGCKLGWGGKLSGLYLVHIVRIFVVFLILYKEILAYYLDQVPTASFNIIFKLLFTIIRSLCSH
jgi:hypothetical protein